MSLSLLRLACYFEFQIEFNIKKQLTLSGVADYLWFIALLECPNTWSNGPLEMRLIRSIYVGHLKMATTETLVHCH